MRRRLVLVIPFILSACSDEVSSPTDLTDTDTGSDAAADTGLSDGSGDPADAATDGSSAPTPTSVGRCDYTNPFSSAVECKEYTGTEWTAESAADNCATDTVGSGMVFTAGAFCEVRSELGRCAVGDVDVDGLTVVLAGDDFGSCGISQTACETFLGGVFTAGEVCADIGPVDPVVPSGVFIPPTLLCTEPLAGEEPGATDGDVCTWTMISGCTEPGRRFADYGDCEPVLTQRPYYGIDYGIETAVDDPRLDDAAYMGEVAWVREQVEACACVCCHSEQTAPRGPSGWYIEGAAIWTDTIPDSGIAMLAGLVDSDALGAYPADQNNGFARDVAGLPTTDSERMQTFFVEEWLRRGGTDADLATIPPFGGPLVSQREFSPGRCAPGIGIDADGTMQWGRGAARYVYVLEAGATNPGVPPNLDLPEGTLWHIAMAPTAQPLNSGLRYGSVPEGATQRVPFDGDAPTLTPAADYYLYVLLDIAVPLQRCLFSAP